MRPNLDNDKYFIEQVVSGRISVLTDGTVINNSTGSEIGYKNTKGYIAIGMKDAARKVRHILAHRLVYLTYGDDELSTEIIVNHKNGIKTDNRIENLEAVTYSENGCHAFRIGLSKISDGQRKRMSKLGKSQRGELSTASILTEDQVNEIRAAYKPRFFTQQELANLYGVSRETIKDIVNWSTWRHLKPTNSPG